MTKVPPCIHCISINVCTLLSDSTVVRQLRWQLHICCAFGQGQLEHECLYCSGAKSTPHQAEQRGEAVCNIHCVVTVVTLFPCACNSNYTCTIYSWSGAAGAGVPCSKVTSTSPYIEVVWGQDGVPGPCGPQEGHARNLKPGQRAWLGSRVVYLVKTCLGQSYCAWAT